ncbi:hypothetical protein LSH36_529g01024 [Paralvinella palmiformis]|uniref:Ion transport domain-containing protein n=1 Tax=Paralvinella palmiformis TaxID=53620 RepID=A0AAD9J810_9ANNE|nr:hypothetical protein LSH36_529g01024 [Paralvinella palmiformis]
MGRIIKIVHSFGRSVGPVCDDSRPWLLGCVSFGGLCDLRGYQPETLTLVLEYSNIIFSALFALEMLLKVLAEGPFGYIQNGFNVFDGFIVILSVVELVQGGTGGLSVLRTFRLLRILKLVRFLPALRYQLVIMLRTMDNVATFFMLLILFIFIFR